MITCKRADKDASSDLSVLHPSATLESILKDCASLTSRNSPGDIDVSIDSFLLSILCPPHLIRKHPVMRIIKKKKSLLTQVYSHQKLAPAPQIWLP